MHGTKSGKALVRLMWAKFTLGALKEESNDYLGNIRDNLSNACNALPDFTGIPNPAKTACWFGKIGVVILYWLLFWGGAIA